MDVAVYKGVAYVQTDNGWADSKGKLIVLPAGRHTVVKGPEGDKLALMNGFKLPAIKAKQDVPPT